MRNVVRILGSLASLTLGLTTSEAHAGYWVTIHSQLDGRCLEADPGTPANTEGARVRMWDCNGAAQQRWYVESSSSFQAGYASLRNEHAKSCLFASYNGSWDILAGLPPRDPNGTAVYLSRCDDYQYGFQWRVSNGVAMQSFSASSMNLDYNPGTMGNGGQVYLWTRPQVPPAQQTWTLAPAEPPKPTVNPPVMPPPAPPPVVSSMDHWRTVVCQCTLTGAVGAEDRCLQDATANETAKQICMAACAPQGALWGFKGQLGPACNLFRVHLPDEDRSDDALLQPEESTPASDQEPPLASTVSE